METASTKMGNAVTTVVAIAISVSLLIFITSCQTNNLALEPEIVFQPPSQWAETLPSAFSELRAEECRQSWGKELLIASQFACEQDLYRAITAYKRALFLIPDEYVQRRQQIEYGIILCYYLGHKYCDAIAAFEKGSLFEVTESFPAYNDLLTILYDSYHQIGNDKRACAIFELIETRNGTLSEKLAISQAVQEGNLPYLSTVCEPDADLFLANFYIQKKSVCKAKALNAILPGAGYLYVGQKQSALTSFVINTLFAAAAVCFFQHRNIPAGIITASLEMGWYLGGIHGAGLAAKEYNERLYETHAYDFLCRKQLFPVLLLNYSF